jgi:hypothetical protein
MYPDSNAGPDFREQAQREQVFNDTLGPKDASRNRQYWLREHHINIRFLSIGCIVDVGCKSIPFLSVDEAMKELNAYVANPKEAIEKWNKILD